MAVEGDRKMGECRGKKNGCGAGWLTVRRKEAEVLQAETRGEIGGLGLGVVRVRQ